MKIRDKIRDKRRCVVEWRIVGEPDWRPLYSNPRRRLTRDEATALVADLEDMNSRVAVRSGAPKCEYHITEA